MSYKCTSVIYHLCYMSFPLFYYPMSCPVYIYMTQSRKAHLFPFAAKENLDKAWCPHGIILWAPASFQLLQMERGHMRSTFLSAHFERFRLNKSELFRKHWFHHQCISVMGGICFQKYLAAFITMKLQWEIISHLCQKKSICGHRPFGLSNTYG